MNEARRGGALIALGAMVVAATMLIVPALAAAFEGNIPTPTPVSTPVNTAAPMLSGNPAPGQTLTCSAGTWSGNPSGFSYAWFRDGVAIAGETASTYVVQAGDQGHSLSCQVTASNRGGEYAILGLPSGSYKVGFHPLEGSYLSQYFNGQQSSTTAIPVPVTAPSVAGGVNAELQAGGQISGKVSSAETHVGIANIYACAEAEVSPHEFAGGCEVTNSAGEYTIVGLPTGSYTVEFQGLEGQYLSQTYKANPVSVSVGSTTPDIDAALSTGGHISGRVTAESGGGALAGAEVCAYEPIHFFFAGCGTANGNGEYTIEGLAGSTYEMFFEAPACSDRSQCARQNYINRTTSGVVVTEGSTTEAVNATLATGGQISGTVSNPAGGSGVQVCARGASQECANTNENGEYTIPGLSTGGYTVEFIPIYGCGTSGCMATNYLPQTYSKNPVSVTAGATTSGVEATMMVAGRISGRITAESGGGGVAGEACGYDPTSHFYGGCAYANSNGEYALQGLGGGTYEVSFYGYRCVETTCVQLNYLGKKMLGVSVTAGSTADLDATLATGGQITGSVTGATTHAALANEEACASAKVGEAGKEEYVESCATTNGAASGVAHSSALMVTPIGTQQVPGGEITPIGRPRVPAGKVTLIGAPQFNAKTGDLVFTFSFPIAGRLSWSLFFKNADVGYGDSLGISLNDDGAVAETGKHKKAKKCKQRYRKHRGRCVRVLVPFAAGSENVLAGTVKVSVHASGKALAALKRGHTLHVSGTFTFQSSLGGKPSKLSITTVVHPAKKNKGKRGKRGGGKY